MAKSIIPWRDVRRSIDQAVKAHRETVANKKRGRIRVAYQWEQNRDGQRSWGLAAKAGTSAIASEAIDVAAEGGVQTATAWARVGVGEFVFEMEFE